MTPFDRAQYQYDHAEPKEHPSREYLENLDAAVSRLIDCPQFKAVNTLVAEYSSQEDITWEDHILPVLMRVTNQLED